MSQTRFNMRHFENVHIPLWLLKDTCWMMHWKWLGVIMIVPTITVAIYIAVRSFGFKQFWLNTAICFWISANAYWMCMEFYNHEELRFYAGIPFLLGFISTAIFYISKNENADA